MFGEMLTGAITGKAWNGAAGCSGASWGKQEGKYVEKCPKAPLPEPPSSLRKFLLAQGSGASLMPSSPCPALLLRGRHGPALHAASLTAPGQTERQPAAHLPALPHQARTPQHMCGLTSGPIVCPLGCLPRLFQFSIPPPPDSLSFVPVPPGPWEGWPRDRKCPQVPTPSSPKAWNCYSAPPSIGKQGTGRAPVCSPQAWPPKLL